jgi:hypothetical protein
MRKPLVLILFLLTIILCNSCSTRQKSTGNNDIIIENDETRLVLTGDGMVKSLVYKPGNIECLVQGSRIPVSTITEPRPYQNEVKLAYPTKRTTFRSDSVRKEGDKLFIRYELIPWEVTVGVKTTSDYIAFTIEKFTLTEDYGITMTEPPISEMWFLQLPVRDLGHYGDWLNVVWDDKVAVNLLAADPYLNANAEERDGYHLLQAGVDEAIRLTGATAALITCSTEKLLDKIAVVERDYNLPDGVSSRRHELYPMSYYRSGNVTPQNVDEHIKYAKMGGFRTMLIYYPSFLEGRGYRKIGNYDGWRPEYPKGKEDLRQMLRKIKDAGITPGVHFLHSHIGRESRYVTPVPDHRLNLLKIYTLSKPLGRNDTTIYVEQNPFNATMAENRRVLKIGTELISYDGFTNVYPYSFTGCKRGIDNTKVSAWPEGYMFGLVDVSEFGRGTSFYLDQNSSLQDDIADMIADIWDAGFEFFYFDGSEGVNPPFWYHVAGGQWRVFRKLKPQPLFAEGAAKTHFSWHMLTRGNAFDVFRPEVLKEETRKHPVKEAPRMKNNFTHINFGWLGYSIPGENTVGTQPDMLEFVTSRAAAWDCPASLNGDILRFEQHRRTPDNLEVMRRWEDVRAQKWLTEEQRNMLKDDGQEHILLINENNQFELVPYDQIMNVAYDSKEVRAFTFTRNKDLYAVYWHIASDRQLELPLNSSDITVMESLGKAVQIRANGNSTVIPVGSRRYIKCGKLSKDELIKAFNNAKLTD